MQDEEPRHVLKDDEMTDDGLRATLATLRKGSAIARESAAEKLRREFLNLREENRRLYEACRLYEARLRAIYDRMKESERRALAGEDEDPEPTYDAAMKRLSSSGKVE